jgi:hypothetical protein
MSRKELLQMGVAGRIVAVVEVALAAAAAFTLIHDAGVWLVWGAKAVYFINWN